MVAGRAAAACASAAVISSELKRTCAGGWPGSLGCSNCSSFFSTDSTFAAAAAGDCAGATGAGFLSTRTRATTDVTKVATLMMRSIFHFIVFISPCALVLMLPGRPVRDHVTEGTGPGVTFDKAFGPEVGGSRFERAF